MIKSTSLVLEFHILHMLGAKKPHSWWVQNRSILIFRGFTVHKTVFFWCLTLRGDARRAHLACDQSPAAGGHRADGGGVAEMIRRYDEMVIFGVSW